jgi:hypothetical protein
MAPDVDTHRASIFGQKSASLYLTHRMMLDSQSVFDPFACLLFSATQCTLKSDSATAAAAVAGTKQYLGGTDDSGRRTDGHRRLQHDEPLR